MLFLTRYLESLRIHRLEREVLKLTRGNRGALERAITARRRRSPSATRLQLLEMVRDDYIRDYSR